MRQTKTLFPSLLFIILFSASLNAQNTQTVLKDLDHPTVVKKPTGQYELHYNNRIPEAKKDGGPITEIWYEDFSNGIPSSWSNVGTIDGNDTSLWEYRGPTTNPDISVGSRGSCGGSTPLASPTQANGFVIFDSNWYDDPGPDCGAAPGSGTVPVPHFGMLDTDPIDCSGSSQILLEWYQTVRHFSAVPAVLISNDGGATFDTVYDARNTHPVNEAMPELGEFISLDVSALAGGSSNVVIRLSWTPSDRIPAFNGYYYWMVDDLRLIEKPENELSILDYSISSVDPESFVVSYGQIPREQSPEVYAQAGVLNRGINDQTNVGTKLYAFGSSSPLTHSSNLNSLMADSLLITNNYVDLSNESNQSFNFSLATVSDSANNYDPAGIREVFDSIDSPNRLTVTDEVYAVDNGYATSEKGSEYVQGTAQDGARFANALFVKNSDTLTAVRIYLGPGTVPGADLLVEIKDTTPSFDAAFDAAMGGDWPNVVLKSNPYHIAHADTASGYVEIPIPEVLSGGQVQDRVLQPNLYYVCVYMFSNAGAQPVTILDDEESKQGEFASIYYYYPDGRWYTNGNAMWIRAIFGKANCVTVTNNISAAICEGETYEVGGQSFSTEGVHSVTFTLPNGCDSIVNLNLTVNPTFNMDLQESICDGDSILFGGQYYYTTGTYTINETSVSGCDSIVELTLSVFSIDTQTSVNSDTLYVSAFADSVQWVDCNTGNVVTTTQANNFFVASQTGTYRAIIYIGGCQAETGCRTVMVSGIEYPKLGKVSIWPNPADHLLNIEVENPQLVQSIELVNASGQFIRDAGEMKGNREVVDISELSNGVYFVRLTFDNRKPVNLKFIKQ